MNTSAKEGCFDCRLPRRAPPRESLCSAALAAPALLRGRSTTPALQPHGLAMSPYPRETQVVSRPQGLPCHLLHQRAAVSRDLILEAGRSYRPRWRLRQHQSCRPPAPAQGLLLCLARRLLCKPRQQVAGSSGIMQETRCCNRGPQLSCQAQHLQREARLKSSCQEESRPGHSAGHSR